MTPEAVEDEVRPQPRRSTRTSPRCAATPATTCRRSRGSGRRPPPSGCASTARSPSWSTGSTRSRARPATRCARTWPRSAQPPAHRAGRATSRCRWPRPTSAPQPCDRDAVHEVFDALQFRVLRERLFATLDGDEPRGRGAASRSSTVARARGAVGSAWLAEHAPAGVRVGLVRRRHAGAAAPATSRRSPIASPDGAVALRRRAGSDARRRAGARGLARRTRPARRRCTTPRGRARAARPRLDARAGSPATPRSRRTSCCPASAPSTSPTSCCATSSASCARRPTRGSGQLSLDADATRPRAASLGVQARAVLDLAERARRRARGARAAPRCCATSSCRCCACSPTGARRHRRRHRPPARASRPSSPSAMRRRRGRRARDGRPGVQPRLAQAAAGGPVRRARPAEDQEDQDRLHHRRRRAAVAVRPDRRTRSSSSCCATATSPSCVRPSRAC